MISDLAMAGAFLDDHYDGFNEREYAYSIIKIEECLPQNQCKIRIAYYFDILWRNKALCILNTDDLPYFLQLYF